MNRQTIVFHSRAYASSNFNTANGVIISINDSPNESYESMVKFRFKGFINGVDLCVVNFSDNNVGQNNHINERTAKYIVDFVNQNSTKLFQIHCLMGVSRSAAVAKFISEYLGVEVLSLENYNLYNKDVYNALWSAAGQPTLKEIYANEGLLED